MKKIYSILYILTILFFVISCHDKDEYGNNDVDESSFFLSGIRPNYFENLNFDSSKIRSEIPNYLVTFRKLHLATESKFSISLQTKNDKENYRLFMQYYSFYITALISNYLDETLSFNEINGNRTIGLFSDKSSSVANYEYVELEAMITEALRIATDAYLINGYNDRAYGFFVLVNQIEKRFKKKINKNDPEAHKLATDFVSYNLQDLEIVPVWNLLMPMVVFTNYEDPLNTFNNKEMENVLEAYDKRLVVPGTLPSIGGKYPEILGPIYKFDINLKKLDWIISQHSGEWSKPDLDEIDKRLQTMSMITNYLELQKSELLSAWPSKSTYQDRKVMLNELRIYRNNISTYPKPNFKNSINSVSFKKAYQCYSCHATPVIK